MIIKSRVSRDLPMLCPCSGATFSELAADSYLTAETVLLPLDGRLSFLGRSKKASSR
jgi:hypothetical protein